MRCMRPQRNGCVRRAGEMRGKGGAAMLRRIRELFNDVFRQADLVLLALCIGTSLFGILMIASATRYMHTSKLVLVQAAALCIGAVLYIVVSQVDLNELAKYWKWIFLVGVVFILLLATPLGIAGDTGNKAWLEFPFLPVKVQPAEIVKLTFIIVLAKQLAWLKENRDLRSISSIVMLAAHFGVILRCTTRYPPTWAVRWCSCSSSRVCVLWRGWRCGGS